MKVMAICERIGGKLPYYYAAGGKTELKEGLEYQVAKIVIGAWSTMVSIRLPDQSIVRCYGGSLRFELVLEGNRLFDERRVPIDIISDLFQERGFNSKDTYHRWMYFDDMPTVETDYVVFFE